MKKVMQKKFFITLIAVFVVLACVVTAVCVLADKEAETMNTSPETNESASEPIKEPESESVTEPQPTEPKTEPTTEPKTTAPAEPVTEPITEAPAVPQLAINYDLLNDIGLSCTELEEKHGKLSGFNTPHGGVAYLYENGYGWYCFRLEPYTVRYIDNPQEYKSNNLRFDENGYYIPIATDKDGCMSIDYIDIRNVLLNASDTVSIAEIEAIEGVTISSNAEKSRPGDPYNFCSSFTVDGYENIFIVFEHDDPETIDLNSHNASIIPIPNP